MSTTPKSLSGQGARFAATCTGAAAILLLTGCGQSAEPATGPAQTTSFSSTTSTTTPATTTSSSTAASETEQVVVEAPPATFYTPASAPTPYVAPAPMGVTCADGSIVADYSKCYDDYPYLGAKQSPPPEGMFPADMTPYNPADDGVTIGPYCLGEALANGCNEADYQ